MANAGTPYGTPSKSSPRKKSKHPWVRYEELMRMYLPLVGGTIWATYTTIFTFRNRKSNQCFPRYQTIADQRGISRRSVMRHVRTLVAVGLLEKSHRFYDDPTRGEHGGQRSNLYRFCHFLPYFDTPGMTRMKPMTRSSSNQIYINKLETPKEEEKSPCDHPWGEPLGYPHQGSWRCSACGDLYTRP